MNSFNLERIVSLVIDNKHHKGIVTVTLSLRRNGGEGLRSATVSGPIPVTEALQTAYAIADRGFDTPEASVAP